MSPTPRPTVPPWLLGVTAMALIQVSATLTLAVSEHAGTVGTVWLRFAIGTLFIWMVARPPLRSVRREDVPGLLVLGIATGLMSTFFLAAIERIHLGTAVAIEFLGPLVLAAVTAHSRRAIVWPILALCGVVLLSRPWSGTVDLIGVGFALATGACWALYNLGTQLVGSRFPGVSGLAMTIPIGVLVLTPVGLPQLIEGAPPVGILALAAAAALLNPALAFSLEMATLRRMSHHAYGTLLAFEPALGTIVGLVALGQVPSAIQALGIALVVVAGAGAQRSSAAAEARTDGMDSTDDQASRTTTANVATDETDVHDGLEAVADWDEWDGTEPPSHHVP